MSRPRSAISGSSNIRKPAKAAAPSAHRTEELLEEIAEAGAAEVKFKFLAALSPAARGLSAAKIFPARAADGIPRRISSSRRAGRIFCVCPGRPEPRRLR